MSTKVRCSGILGWLFGHDWTAWTVGSGVQYRHCSYCGCSDVRPDAHEVR